MFVCSKRSHFLGILHAIWGFGGKVVVWILVFLTDARVSYRVNKET